MPNVAALLKSEISRIARKEVRSHTTALAKASTEQKKQIASLRRQVAELQRALKKSQRTQPAPTRPDARDDATTESSSGLRWRPEGFAQHRKRLGLSAEQMARLIGCSALSVYKWESGKVRPRQAQLEAIANVRKLSKKQALRQLEASEEA